MFLFFPVVFLDLKRDFNISRTKSVYLFLSCFSFHNNFFLIHCKFMTIPFKSISNWNSIGAIIRIERTLKKKMKKNLTKNNGQRRKWCKVERTENKDWTEYRTVYCGRWNIKKKIKTNENKTNCLKTNYDDVNTSVASWTMTMKSGFKVFLCPLSHINTLTLVCSSWEHTRTHRFRLRSTLSSTLEE